MYGGYVPVRAEVVVPHLGEKVRVD